MKLWNTKLQLKIEIKALGHFCLFYILFFNNIYIYILFYILVSSIIFILKYFILLQLFFSFLLYHWHLIRQFLKSSMSQKYIKKCMNISACLFLSLLDSDLSVCHYCSFLGVRPIKKIYPGDCRSTLSEYLCSAISNKQLHLSYIFSTRHALMLKGNFWRRARLYQRNCGVFGV